MNLYRDSVGIIYDYADHICSYMFIYGSCRYYIWIIFTRDKSIRQRYKEDLGKIWDLGLYRIPERLVQDPVNLLKVWNKYGKISIPILFSRWFLDLCPIILSYILQNSCNTCLPDWRRALFFHTGNVWT